MEKLGGTFVYTSIAFCVRILIINSSYQGFISKRLEISTPINSWQRAKEGLYLQDSGISPYEGDTFHEYPVSLYFYRIINSLLGQNVHYFFVLVDILTALLLQYATYHQLINILHLESGLAREKSDNLKKRDNQKTSESIFELEKLTKSKAVESSQHVLLVYLFSPATILPCVGMSTTVFTNALIAMMSVAVTKGPLKVLTCLLGGLISCNVLHYSVIIIPAILCIEQGRVLESRRKQQEGQSRSRATHINEPKSSGDLYIHFRRNWDSWDSIYTSTILYLISTTALIAISYLLCNYSFDFVSRTFVFTLKISDLSPNIGMCWYFFTEMFDHFHEFFKWVVQINAFIHVIPITIGLRRNPYFAMFIVLLVSTIFQPYPSIANFGLITSLLPQWSYLFNYTRRGIITSCTMITCILLAPVLWHLWIVMGTANSNFYFGVTLAFTAAQILLLADMLFAHSKRGLSLRQL